MFRTPTAGSQEQYRGNSDMQTTTPENLRAGPSTDIRPQNVRKSIERIEQESLQSEQGSPTKTHSKQVRSTSGGEPSKSTKLHLPTQKAVVPPKAPGPLTKEDKNHAIQTTTVTKVRKNNSTPSPLGRLTYASRADEALAVHRKGLENLNKFLNLRKDVKLEIKKALDRLYDLTKATPVARDLEKEWASNSQKTTKDTPTQTDQERSESECAIMTTSRDDKEILRKLVENNKILLENKQKMEEIKHLIENQTEKYDRVTYASTAAPRTAARSIMERGALHSVVVTSENDQDTGEEVLERVRQAVDAKKGWVVVERVRKAKDRKIVMSCRTEEERSKVKDKLEKAGVRLIVEEVKNKDPLLVLKDVLSVHSDEEVLRALRNQNRDVFHGLGEQEDRATVKYRKKTRSPLTSHIVLSVSPAIWRRAIETEKVRVDLQQVFVEDQSPLVQCSKCLGYGHGRRFCREPQDLCSHCGGPHLRTACSDQMAGEPPACVNCKRAKTDTHRHNAFSHECPVRKKWDSIARASVSYC